VPHAGAGERRVGAPYCGARLPFPGSLAARPVLNGLPQPPHHGGRRVVEPHATGRSPQHAARSSAAPRRARATEARRVAPSVRTHCGVSLRADSLRAAAPWKLGLWRHRRNTPTNPVPVPDGYRSVRAAGPGGDAKP